MLRSTIGDIQDKIKKLELDLEHFKEEGIKELGLIEGGAKFGYIDPMDMFGGYFPCELLEVMDREKFIIKVREISVNKITITDVFGLYILKS